MSTQPYKNSLIFERSKFPQTKTKSSNLNLRSNIFWRGIMPVEEAGAILYFAFFVLCNPISQTYYMITCWTFDIYIIYIWYMTYMYMHVCLNLCIREFMLSLTRKLLHHINCKGGTSWSSFFRWLSYLYIGILLLAFHTSMHVMVYFTYYWRKGTCYSFPIYLIGRESKIMNLIGRESQSECISSLSQSECLHATWGLAWHLMLYFSSHGQHTLIEPLFR